MSVFKFNSGGSLIVETSEDDASTKTIATTIDTWPAATDTGRRRMPRDSGTYVRFRDSANSANTTGWLTFKGNVDNWGYHAKDTGGFWNVHISDFVNETGELVAPVPQSPRLS